MRETEYPRLGERVWRETLPNGLEVIVVRKPYHVRKYAFFAARYGGMDLRFQLEGRRRVTPAGVAHYLEHKLFESQDGNLMQEMGRSGVDPNAFTAEDMTAYYFSCTDGFYRHLGELLRFVTAPYFTRESVERERGIIAQEIRMTEDDPEWRAYEGMMRCLYGDGPAALPVVGTVESIQSITPQLLYDCHRAFYTPANMVLVCVGDVEPDRAAEIAMEILPAESGPVPAREVEKQNGFIPLRREAMLEMEVSMPQFMAGFKCPAHLTGETLLREGMIGDLACDALFGESSPLYTQLYGQGLINSSLGGGFDQLPGACQLYVGGDAREPRRVLDEILAEARRLGEQGIPEDFFRQIRRAAYGGMLRGLNSFEGIAGSLAEGRFDGYDYFRFPEIFGTVTKQDVEAFLREHITPEHAAISLVVPPPRGAAEV